MKIISNIFSVILLLVLFSGCGKDNFDAPESKLVGRVTYQGQALNLRGTGEAVQLQLYQDGYEKNDPISVFVGQDGTFSALLFDGEYRLTTRVGNGPWVRNREFERTYGSESGSYSVFYDFERTIVCYGIGNERVVYD